MTTYSQTLTSHGVILANIPASWGSTRKTHWSSRSSSAMTTPTAYTWDRLPVSISTMLLRR